MASSLESQLERIVSRRVNEIQREFIQEITNTMEQFAVEARNEAMEKYDYYRTRDPEYQLETFRQPDLAAIVAMMNTKPDVDYATGRISMQLFDKSMLDVLGIRGDMSVEMVVGKDIKTIHISGGKRPYPYWRVLEYGIHASKTHYPFYFKTNGGYGVFMRKRTPRVGLYKAYKYYPIGGARAAKEAAKVKTVAGTSAEYIASWPPPPGFRVLTGIKNRYQQKLNDYVREVINR